MTTNADACELIADRVEVDPLGIPAEDDAPAPEQIN